MTNQKSDRIFGSKQRFEIENSLARFYVFDIHRRVKIVTCFGQVVQKLEMGKKTAGKLRVPHATVRYARYFSSRNRIFWRDSFMRDRRRGRIEARQPESQLFRLHNHLRAHQRALYSHNAWNYFQRGLSLRMNNLNSNIKSVEYTHSYVLCTLTTLDVADFTELAE